MVDIRKIEEMRKQYPDLCVVCYINSTAEIKTHADVCVTSANAVKIVKNLPNQNLFFIPDGNLGRYVKEQVPEKNIMLNDGFCPIHHNLTKEMVLETKKEHPDALFLVHPECTWDVLQEADYIGSTSGIIRYAGESSAQEFIVGTESGVFYKLQTENPEKKFYLANSGMVCVNMKKVTLEKILAILETECNEVFLPDAWKEKAMAPLSRMLEYAK
jgi:quinolinate synthase